MPTHDTPPDDSPPVEILPPAFAAHARAAVEALNETVLTNHRRALAGHPPVPCQLTGEQAESLAAMVWGLTFLRAGDNSDREGGRGA